MYGIVGKKNVRLWSKSVDKYIHMQLLNQNQKTKKLVIENTLDMFWHTYESNAKQNKMAGSL